MWILLLCRSLEEFERKYVSLLPVCKKVNRGPADVRWGVGGSSPVTAWSEDRKVTKCRGKVQRHRVGSRFGEPSVRKSGKLRPRTLYWGF